jgi:type I restriction enzyme S subunit
MAKPQLRFPEFTDEWQVKNLGNIADFFDGKRIPIESTQRRTMHGNYPYYGASGIIDYVNDYIFDGEYVLLAEDGANILMRSTPVAFIAKGKFWLNNHAHIMKAHGSNSFLAAYLEQLKYDNYNTGTTQPKLNAAVVKRISVTLPSELEQQKIADFLTAIDKKIESIDKRVELLKRYKKGVMQKIFTQQLRFKDENGSNYPDWQEKKTGEIFTNVSNRNHNDNLPMLSATQDGGIVIRDSLDRKIDQSNLGIRNHKVIEPGDFVISLRSFQGGIEYSSILGISSPAYTVLRGNDEVVPEMFKHYFKRQGFISRLNSTVIGIRDGKQISYEPFSTLKILLPSIDEQYKIAHFLTKIDDKITIEETKLVNTRKFKKALLQRMLV